MLTIELDLLTGVSVAAAPQRRETAEWPPQPDRLFQALVAAWGRNEPPRADERAALEWLERLDPEQLTIFASPAFPRDVLRAYVPPNDIKGTSPDALPEHRSRKERYFPAVIPAVPVVRYVWRRAEGLQEHRDALMRLVREVTYVGHSHTMVRVAVRDGGEEPSDLGDVLGWTQERASDVRVAHPGRLAHLTARYDEAARPYPSLAIRTMERPEEGAPGTVFDPGNVTVLSDAGGFVPSLEAFPLVAKRLRDALLSLVPPGVEIPALLSGHDASGQPARAPHLAIVPLADVGWRYSQGRLMGVALVWPRAVAPADRAVALRAVMSFLGNGGELRLGRSGVWRLQADAASDKASLRTDRYVAVARVWTTVLPATIDRYPKDRRGQDLAGVVLDACRNVGLPDEVLRDLRVVVSSDARLTGAPSSFEVSRVLPADSPYRGRPLRHLRLTFPRPVGGPLALGAGRFRGLGWCVSVDRDVSG